MLGCYNHYIKKTEKVNKQYPKYGKVDPSYSPSSIFWWMKISFYPSINFGRYCKASATCAAWIASLPARSAVVGNLFENFILPDFYMMLLEVSSTV
jgi:hypothetical protein